ncbi:hypothetical protein NDU88_001872 [Pleurodeles waltl]|uniref:Uncharacterized protein n=1 Tax=Pleurodeles waltl TaxID=8319 RepID=A0AAV7NLF9_PLEWA|nr:hypothetical protein NDU88_001872 [Pleurodeles waltl]
MPFAKCSLLLIVWAGKDCEENTPTPSAYQLQWVSRIFPRISEKRFEAAAGWPEGGLGQVDAISAGCEFDPFADYLQQSTGASRPLSR